MNFSERFSAGVAHPPSLQLLFGHAEAIPVEHFTAVLRAYHSDLAAASVEMLPVSEVPGHESLLSAVGPAASVLGIIEWGTHAVKLAAFAEPMPAMAIDACLQAALLPPEVKADARGHASHMLLYYAGSDERPLEQLVALAAVAGALAEFGAIVTLNEEARAAILSTDLLPDQPGEDMLAVLRSLPIPYLYGGFVKLTLSDTPGAWWRTFANHRLGLPELAYYSPTHEEGQATFRLFSGLLGYLMETKLPLEEGEVLRFDESTLLQVRAPAPAEWWLDSPGPLRVLERVD